MGRFARTFEPFYRLIRNDIFEFCKALNYEPTWQQRQVLEVAQSPRVRKQIAVKSGKGPGKTRLSCVVALWRAIQFPDTLTVVTAPTQRQAKDIWLSEAKSLIEQANPMLRNFIKPTKSLIEFGGHERWQIKTVTATRKENAQGYHRQNMTIICEEASGISREIINAFKETLSNPNSFMLMIGNPNTRDCAFFDCFNSQREEWETLTLNAEETPRSKWFDPARNAAIEKEFGRESDVYRVSVLGEFPHMDPNCVISSEDLEACTKTDPYACAKAKRNGNVIRQIGIDLARFGSDESVVYRRSGNTVVEWKVFAKVDPADVIDYAFRRQVEAGWRDDETWYVADAGGMGQGVMHKFHRAKKQILEFHTNGKSSKQEYKNRMTEAWFELAKKVRAKEFHIPTDNTLIQQLSTRQYYTDKDGKLVLETKDDYKDRGYNSPDRADAMVMACYEAVEAVGRVAGAAPGVRIGQVAR